MRRTLMLSTALLIGAAAACAESTASSSSNADVVVAVRGEAYDIQEILVPGRVTIIEFGAEW